MFCVLSVDLNWNEVTNYREYHMVHMNWLLPEQYKSMNSKVELIVLKLYKYMISDR